MDWRHVSKASETSNGVTDSSIGSSFVGPSLARNESDSLGKIIFRHLRMIALIVFGTVCTTFAFTSLLEKQFEASKVVVISPFVTKFQNDDISLRRYGMSPAVLETEVEILKSQTFAAEVADLLSLYDNPDFAGQIDPEDPAAVQFSREQTVDRTLESYSVRRFRNSMAVEIRATANSQKLATDIANTVSRNYSVRIEERRRNDVKWALEKLRKRSDRLGKDLFKAEAELASLIRDNEFGDPSAPQRLRAEISKLSTILEVVSSGPANAGQKEQIEKKLSDVESELQEWATSNLFVERQKRLIEQLQLSYVQSIEKLDDLETHLSSAKPQKVEITSTNVYRNAVWPNIPVSVALSGVAAFAVSVIIALIVDGFNRRIKTEQQAARVTRVPSLGRIGRKTRAPKPIKNTRKFQGHQKNAQLNLRSASRRILLRGNTDESETRFLMVSSTLPGEGKSIASKLIATEALADQLRVLAVDIDFDSWELSKLLQAQMTSVSLRSFSSRNLDFREVDLEIANEKMSFLQMDIRDTSTGSEFRDSLEYFKNSVAGYFDLVIFDAPAILIRKDASRIGPLVDASVVVFRSGSSTEDELRDVVGLLQNNGATIAGTLMNCLHDKSILSFRREGYSDNYSNKSSFGAV